MPKHWIRAAGQPFKRMFIMFKNVYKFLKTFFLIASIMRQGDIGAPILASKERIVIDGNSRLRIAKLLNFQSVPVVFIDAKVERINPSELKEGY